MSADPRSELAASLRRRGIPVPARPYEPAFAPYKRPPPRVIEDTRAPGDLAEEDRAALLEMADAGAPWEQIEEAYPAMSARQLRVAIGRERSKRTRQANEAHARTLCVDCGEPHGRTGNAKRCLACAREYERDSERARMAAYREVKRRGKERSELCAECFRPHGRSGTAVYCLECARKQKIRRAMASNAARRKRQREEAA